MECFLIYMIYLKEKERKEKRKEKRGGQGKEKKGIKYKGAIYKVPEKKPYSNGPCE